MWYKSWIIMERNNNKQTTWLQLHNKTYATVLFRSMIIQLMTYLVENGDFAEIYPLFHTTSMHYLIINRSSVKLLGKFLIFISSIATIMFLPFKSFFVLFLILYPITFQKIYTLLSSGNVTNWSKSTSFTWHCHWFHKWELIADYPV